MTRNKSLNALCSIWAMVNGATSAEGLPESLSMSIALRSFDIESLDNPENNMSQTPPIRFLPLPVSFLEAHPVSGALDTSAIWYDLSAGGTQAPEYSHHYAIAEMVCDYVEELGLGTVRQKLPISLARHQGLARISSPDPFLLYADFDSTPSGNWSAYTILESAKQNGLPTNPHVTMMAIHDHIGENGSILYGELALLVSAMYSRASQQNIPDELQEHKAEKGLNMLDNHWPRIFESEKNFPVLMLSFLGPQHGRVLYACMDDEELVIRQSRLYFLGRKGDPSFDLFTRLLVSTPLSQ